MTFDLRRCVEAAAHAALAEAFVFPEPKQSRRRRRRRLRPLRALLRLVRVSLMGVGVVTTVHAARDRELRRAALGALAERLPIEDLLAEIAVELEAVRSSLDNDPDAEPANEDADEAGPQTNAQGRRRSVSRSRGDTNGQRGRKPPNRGTRAA